MKKFLTLIMLCGVICSYAQNTPTYAASTHNGVLGGLTGRDAIIQMRTTMEDDTLRKINEDRWRMETNDPSYYKSGASRRKAARLNDRARKEEDKKDTWVKKDNSGKSVFDWKYCLLLMYIVGRLLCRSKKTDMPAG